MPYSFKFKILKFRGQFGWVGEASPIEVTTMGQVYIFIPTPTAFHISVPGTGLGDGREGKSSGHTGLVLGGTV